MGPEDPLLAGIVDEFTEAGLAIFGPSKKAVQIEGSKTFAKELMLKADVRTARYRSFTSFPKALTHVKTNLPCFIKADGQASGKGAIPCRTFEEARTALKRLLIDREFGNAGDIVIIEEFLEGEELSYHALCDAYSSVLFPPARDHKRALDHDLGENTGGMGTVAPVPVSYTTNSIVQTLIVDRTLEAMEEYETPYRGLLFPGLILTLKNGPKVLEFNARFGDPETQVFMRLLESDLIDLIEATLENRLAKIKVNWHQLKAACVILASGGYPGPYEKGKSICGIKEAEKIPGIIVFHSATVKSGDMFFTAGGRVLGVSAIGFSFKEAIDLAYKAVDLIQFEGMQYRRDIGHSLLMPDKEG